jgi:hypothetical protein
VSVVFAPRVLIGGGFISVTFFAFYFLQLYTLSAQTKTQAQVL